MRYWKYLVLVCLQLPVVHASEATINNPLTLDQVMLRVLEGNPQLKQSDLGAAAAAARIRHARLGTPTTIKLELGNIAGSNNYQNDNLAETTLSVAKVLEFGDKPTLRGAVATQQATLLHNEQSARRLDILSEAARRFVHVIIDQQRLLIAKDKMALVERTFRTVKQRVKAGRSPVAERRRVAIAVARAEVELEHAEHELATSRLKLVTMWGETATTFGMAQGALFQLQKVAAFEQLEKLLDRNPDLLRYATTQRLAEARVQLAQSRRRADIELSGGVRYFSNTDDSAFILSATIPLGSASRAAPRIEETELHAQQEPYRYTQRRLELHASLYEIYQELLHARTAVDALRQKIIPEAKRALRDYEKGYAAGRYSLLELTDAQRSLLEARLEAAMAASNYHRNRIEIERLTGMAMPTAMQTGVSQ